MPSQTLISCKAHPLILFGFEWEFVDPSNKKFYINQINVEV
jgi:hypothetical protein